MSDNYGDEVQLGTEKLSAAKTRGFTIKNENNVYQWFSVIVRNTINDAAYTGKYKCLITARDYNFDMTNPSTCRSVKIIVTRDIWDKVRRDLVDSGFKVEYHWAENTTEEMKRETVPHAVSIYW